MIFRGHTDRGVGKLALMLATSSLALMAYGSKAMAQAVVLQEVEVISTTPVPGAAGIDANKVPSVCPGKA